MPWKGDGSLLQADLGECSSTMVGSFLWCLVLALESRQESFLLLDEEMLERSLGGSLD
jgi:hypothetical protein